MHSNEQDKLPTSITLNDLEPQIFRNFQPQSTLSEGIFAEITGDRPSEPAYEIKLTLLHVS